MKYKIFACISGAILLMVVALHYGYPLVTSDSNAYIHYGFEPDMPADRSPFYGFFLRHSSLWTSLWYTIFAQALILSFLLIRYIRHIYGTEPGIRQIMFNLLVIISCTGVSWVCSYLMPDVFGAILLLAILLFLCEKDTPRLHKVLYILFIVFSVIAHNSHIVILGLFSGLLLLASLVKKQRRYTIKSISLLSISIATFFFICIMNQVTSQKFVFSKGSHVFMMGKLAETGVLEAYLDANCEKKPYALCNYRSELRLTAMQFIWNPDAPFYKTGGWDSSATEYNAIIRDIFTTPKFAGMFLLKSLSYTFRQLTQMQIPKPLAGQAAYVHPKIEKYFRSELIEFRNGGQNHWDNKDIGAYNKFYLLALAVSTIVILAIYNRLPDKRSILLLYALLSCFIFCNAYVTATFANVLDRLNIKIFWLLPATNLIIIIRYLSNKWSARPEISKN